MSFEVFSDEGVYFDTDTLTRRGWISNEDGDKWWKEDEPEILYTTDEAIQAYIEWVTSDD
jgi:hypothetical protein